MRNVKIYTVDAFTNDIFSGNPAGVVPFADELTETEMQNIAKEINLSETAFILKSKNPSHFKIKYFTPAQEIDFCGHATIALSYILGSVYKYAFNAENLILETNVGMLMIDWVLENKELKSVVMTQVEPKIRPFTEEFDFSILGLNSGDTDDNFKIGLGYTGNWHLFIPVKNRTIIDKAVPDYQKLKEHNKIWNIATTHLYTFNHDEKDCLIYTRDFAPAAGVDEDPVTGSANGALAGFLILTGYLPENKEYMIKQGNTRNRMGNLLIRTKRTDNKIKIQVGGNAVIVMDGMLILD